MVKWERERIILSKFLSSAGFTIVVAAAAVVVYAQKRAAETGRDTMTVLANLPAELKESQTVWQEKLETALEAGKEAAARKEVEIDRQLEEKPAAAPGVDYIV